MSRGSRVRMAHGAGGRLTAELVAEVFAAEFGGPVLARLEDAAELYLPGRRLAFTTDCHVVRPLVSPNPRLMSVAFLSLLRPAYLMNARRTTGGEDLEGQ